MENKLKWGNLKLNKCPKCGKTFDSESFRTPGIIACSNKMPWCDFRIRETRYSQIVNSQITARIERELDEEYHKLPIDNKE